MKRLIKKFFNLVMGYKSIVPNVNMVKNIGMGESGTHTFGDHPLTKN
ncbi:MAG: hypothetical protein WC622_01900 [Pedobacter sp.]|jgi:hypothetical protein